VDKVHGNYWVIFVLPTIFHQDERYYAMGRGEFWKRALYSSTSSGNSGQTSRSTCFTANPSERPGSIASLGLFQLVLKAIIGSTREARRAGT
jgi:hypothetical protein